MILNVSHISKAFSGEQIIRDASFFLNERDKAAITGLNGAGKTTLLNMITGELPSDSGIVTLKKDCTMGYLHQNNNIDSALTIREELTQVIQPLLDMEIRIREMQEAMKHTTGEDLEALYREYNRVESAYEQAEGYSARSRLAGVLNGLGFSAEEADKKLHDLSGGQKTRVFLGKLLLERPDLILLDEPTNHLDLSSIEWLETFLMNYSGSVIIVSHDRYFLDRIVNKVIDIENGEVTAYTGNYTQFAEKKAAVREAKLRAYLNQQQELKHQEEVIAKLKSFNREKSIRRAESREKMLSKTERLERPGEIKADMGLQFTMEEASGSDVLEVSGISKSFGSLKLFEDLSFDLKRGEHAAIIGDNGAGKTTILKILNGLLPPDSGTITLGARVMIAYYDQEHAVLHPEKTIFEEVQDTWPDMNNTEVRSMLAAFLFTGDDVFKRIADLSGGERGRVSLAKLMLSRANFLILDEPTNHLDMVSKEVLEQAIRSFPGTVLYVSHDRYFINRRVPRPVFRGKDRHPYPGSHPGQAFKLHRKLRLLPGKEGGRGARGRSFRGPGRKRCLQGRKRCLQDRRFRKRRSGWKQFHRCTRHICRRGRHRLLRQGGMEKRQGPEGAGEKKKSRPPEMRRTDPRTGRGCEGDRERVSEARTPAGRSRPSEAPASERSGRSRTRDPL